MQANLLVSGSGDTDARQIGYDNKPGYAIGLVASILMAISIIPYIGFILFIGGAVCRVSYWVQVADFNRKFAQPA